MASAATATATTLPQADPAPPAYGSRSIPKELLNYIFNDGTNTEAFDVQPLDQRVEGQSPYAVDTNKNGPSVIAPPQRLYTTGLLDSTYKFTEESPELGRTYFDVDLRDVLKSNELTRDLAITIAERGVVFFRNQHDLSAKEQKELIDKFGKLTGKPKTSGLHIHPIQLNGGLLDGDKIDPEISVISSRHVKKQFEDAKKKGLGGSGAGGSQYSRGVYKTGWHSDITFEPVPSDFTSLRLVETPSAFPTEAELARHGGGAVGGSGGDTGWASGYGLAERISPHLLAFLETLTGEFSQPVFNEILKRSNVPIYSAPRGAPENVGSVLLAHHPVVRTNPITGWKSIFAIGEHFNRFVELTQSESDILRDYLLRVLTTTPEIQLRFKWNAGDIAIWDNRSNYHTVISDIVKWNPDFVRTGVRVVGIGERPYLDPNSTTRWEALGSNI